MNKFRAISGWNNPGSVAPPPIQPSQFERMTAKLGLATLEQQKNSEELKAWAKRNRYHRFVPEDLLLHWNLKIEFHVHHKTRSSEEF